MLVNCTHFATQFITQQRMKSTKKDQIFGIQSSTVEDENEESSASERVYHDNNNINPFEDKGSPPNDSRTGLHFRIKINNNNNNNNCCYLCRKKFPTLKSLCGHMRSHPEREWRGIQPPLYLNDDVVVESSSSNHSSDVDLSASLCWGWSTTAKRGRKSLSSSSSVEVQQHHMLQEGVYELMLLAGVLQWKDNLAASVESEEGSDHGSMVGIDIENINTKKKKKKGTKRMKLNEIGMNKLDVIETTKRFYKKKSFQCYQSLGGHLSNHKNKSNTIQSIVEFQSHEHDHHGNITTIMESFDGTKSSLEEAKSSQAPSLVQKCPKILSFDLNMPPTMDEEEKGIQSQKIIPKLSY